MRFDLREGRDLVVVDLANSAEHVLGIGDSGQLDATSSAASASTVDARLLLRLLSGLARLGLRCRPRMWAIAPVAARLPQTSIRNGALRVDDVGRLAERWTSG